MISSINCFIVATGRSDSEDGACVIRDDESRHTMMRTHWLIRMPAILHLSHEHLKRKKRPARFNGPPSLATYSVESSSSATPSPCGSLNPAMGMRREGRACPPVSSLDR